MVRGGKVIHGLVHWRADVNSQRWVRGMSVRASQEGGDPRGVHRSVEEVRARGGGMLNYRSKLGVLDG